MNKAFTFNIHGFAVSVELNDEQREKLAEIIPLKREWDSLRGFSTPDVLYTEDVVLDFVVFSALKDGHTLDEALKEELEYLRLAIEHEKELRGDVPTRNPSSDEPGQEAETAPNAEEVASADEKTRLSVRMADGSLTTMTLDEIDKHREAARGESEPPEANLDPDDGEDFLSVTPLPCSYPHDPTAQYTPYDPALYENDAYECGSIVVDDPEVLAFVDALCAVPCR